MLCDSEDLHYVNAVTSLLALRPSHCRTPKNGVREVCSSGPMVHRSERFMPAAAEKYLKPEVIRQVARLDLRAKFIIEGFISGLHASPFHGFSVEFSEHRRYVPGDDLKDIDWSVYGRTDRFYIKKFEAETNVTGYLAMDLSASMGYTKRQELTKFEYGICLAAALAYLMIHQQDPVGVISFDEKVRRSLPPHSRRTQLGNILALLANLKPTGGTDLSHALHQMAAMVRHRSLVMLFSDLLPAADTDAADLESDTKPVVNALQHLRHRGHDVILFHILDEAEVTFPFDAVTEFEDPESAERLTVDARSIQADYIAAVRELQSIYRRECNRVRIDYVPVHTGMRFDRALMSYLVSRQGRG